MIVKTKYTIYGSIRVEQKSIHLLCEKIKCKEYLNYIDDNSNIKLLK